MKRKESHRRFNVASLVSLVLAVFTLVLWLLTFAVTPWDHRISFTQNFHVSVWRGFSDDIPGRLVFFNATNGPFVGGTIALSSTNDPPPVRRIWHLGKNGFGHITILQRGGEISERFCDLPGVYFRHIRWFNNYLPVWTLAISFWCLFFLFSILPMVWIFRRWRARYSKPSPSLPG